MDCQLSKLSESSSNLRDFLKHLAWVFWFFWVVHLMEVMKKDGEGAALSEFSEIRNKAYIGCVVLFMLMGVRVSLKGGPAKREVGENGHASKMIGDLIVLLILITFAYVAALSLKSFLGLFGF